MASVKQQFDVCACRKYSMRDGTEKKHWINVGRGAQWDDGGISIELHAVPVGSWFDGKLSLFVKKDKDDRKPASARKAASSDGFEDTDLPF